MLLLTLILAAGQPDRDPLPLKRDPKPLAAAAGPPAAPAAPTIIPPGMHAHRRTDGTILVHGNQNLGSAPAHAGVPRPWIRIGEAGQPVPPARITPASNCPGDNCPARR